LVGRKQAALPENEVASKNIQQNGRFFTERACNLEKRGYLKCNHYFSGGCFFDVWGTFWKPLQKRREKR
jgi:hypothetical protein